MPFQTTKFRLFLSVCLCSNPKVIHLIGWLVVLGFNTLLQLLGHIMAVVDTHVFLGFLIPVLTQPFFLKPQTTFLTCFYRAERQKKYAGKKDCLNCGSNNHQVMSLTHSPLSHPGGADLENM